MAVDFFKKFIDGMNEADTSIAVEGKSAAEFDSYIDTGSYILNAALSGTIFGGIPNNKAVVFAGDPGTGKTFFALGIIKNFLETNPKARVFYFDTESAVTNKMLSERGIDLTRVAKSEPDSIERFRTVALKALDAYAAIDEKERFPFLMVLDSISMLPSKKEIADISEGKDTKDMTKTQLLKGAFRVLRLKWRPWRAVDRHQSRVSGHRQLCADEGNGRRIGRKVCGGLDCVPQQESRPHR
jgi:RecA/RadA recombinase